MLQYHCAVQKKVNSNQIVFLPQSDRQIKTFTGVHTYIHKAYLHACVHMCTHMYMLAHTQICMHTNIHVHIYHSQEDTGRQSPAGLSFPEGHLTSTYSLLDPREVIPRVCAGSKDLEEKINKMVPRTRRTEARTLRHCDCPSVCQQMGSPHCWKEEPFQKDEQLGGSGLLAAASSPKSTSS